MTTLTIYNHGSGGWSGKPASKVEIVNLFSNAHAKAAGAAVVEGKKVESFNFECAQPYIITEGVGGKGDPHMSKITFDEQKGVLFMHDGKKAGKTSRTGSRMRANALGKGVQQNIANIIELLRYYKALHNSVPTRINMIGWSRGAVTCIRLAYELFYNQPDYRHIPINIFAVDPVAGGGADKEDQGSFLTPNVKKYLAVLAHGENRAAFCPKTKETLHVVDSRQTQVAYIHFPGVHSDVAKRNSPVGELAFSVCARFLYSVGTNIKDHYQYMLSQKQTLQFYHAVVTNDKKMWPGKWKKKHKWYDISQRAKGAGFKKRNLAFNDVSSSAFMNVHHEAVFQACFRKIYDRSFGAMRHLASPTGPDMDTSWFLLESTCPGFGDVLKSSVYKQPNAEEAAWRGFFLRCQLV